MYQHRACTDPIPDPVLSLKFSDVSELILDSPTYIGLLAVISCNGHCLRCVNNTIHLSQSCTTSGNPITDRQRRTIFPTLE